MTILIEGLHFFSEVFPQGTDEGHRLGGHLTPHKTVQNSYKQPALEFCFQQCSVDSQTPLALPPPSPLAVFWLEEAADKTLQAAAELGMCQERLGSLGADGNGVRSAAGRSWGDVSRSQGIISVSARFLWHLFIYLYLKCFCPVCLWSFVLVSGEQ